MSPMAVFSITASIAYCYKDKLTNKKSGTCLKWNSKSLADCHYAVMLPIRH